MGGKLLEVGQGAMSMKPWRAGASSVLKAGHASIEGLSTHPGAAALHPAGNIDASFTGEKNKPCRAGDDKPLT